MISDIQRGFAAMTLIGALNGPWHGSQVNAAGVFDRSISEPVKESASVCKAERPDIKRRRRLKG